jgi:hypothetical protein
MFMRTALSILLASIAIPAMAGSSTAQMFVSVRVIGRTILTVDEQPAIVQVTASDVARGYVDVPQAIAFRVRSNAAGGYALQFAPVSFPFKDAELALNSERYQRGDTSGIVRVRLLLSPATRPGRYPWPIQLTAASL